MKPTYSLITIVILSLVFASKLYSQIDTSGNSWINQIGISHRFSSKPSNELGTDQSGIQYNLDIGYEWKCSSKNMLGLVLSGQLLGENYDAYFTPMLSWRYLPSVDWSHRFAAGPILLKSYNDEDLFNGFSISYDLEISNKIAITNRFDILNDSKISPILSYSPGIELRGKFAKVVIIGGTSLVGIGAIFVFHAISKSN